MYLFRHVLTCFYFSTCTCFCTYYSLKVITSFLIICWSFVKWWTRKVQKFKKSSQLWIFFGPLAIWLRFQLWKLMKIYKTWTARAHTFSISMLSWFDVFVVWWIKIESNLKHSNELNPRNYIFKSTRPIYGSSRRLIVPSLKVIGRTFAK